MRKLSVFYEHILQACEQSGKTIPEVLAFCREQGISAVEMNYSLFASEREVIAPMLSDAGLVISCMHETFDFPMIRILAEHSRCSILRHRSRFRVSCLLQARLKLPKRQSLQPAAAPMRQRVLLWPKTNRFKIWYMRFPHSPNMRLYVAFRLP